MAYSVGRSLTASDFALQDRYLAQRLLGVAPAGFGAMTGLGLSPARYDSPDGSTGLSRIVVAPGYGIGADGRVVRVTTPLDVAWADIVAVAAAPATALADGAYALIVRTTELDVLEGPPPDPCQRGSPDPLLDERVDSFVELTLSKQLGVLPAGRTPADIALALNTLVGSLSLDTLRAAIGNGIPLGLVLVAGKAAIVLSQAAGRLAADSGGLQGTLLAQTREVFVMAAAPPAVDPFSPAGQAAIRARFRYLPAAGELPVGLLLTPDAATASCPFFPPGVAVYLRAVRASQAARMVSRSLVRAPLDLVGGVAEGVVLSLAVADAAWTPNLMDIPRGDPVLAGDLHLAYARARSAQAAARADWITLYGGIASHSDAIGKALGFLLSPTTAATQLLGFLAAQPADLKIPNSTLMLDAADHADDPAYLANWITTHFPALTIPADLPAQLTQNGYQVVDVEPPVPTAVPVPSDQVLAPLVPALPQGSDFASWTTAITAASPDPALLAPLLDAGIVIAGMDAQTQAKAIQNLLAAPAGDDSVPGALLRLTTLQLFHAAFSAAVLAYERRLTAHNRLLGLLRLHLDMLSTSVSCLAGGVPPDGSGLQFTRIIPFLKLVSAGPAPTPPAPAATPPVSPSFTFNTQAFRATESTGALSVARLATFKSSQTVSQVNTFSSATLASRAVLNDTALSSAIRAIPIDGAVSTAPSRSKIGSILGKTDLSASVAAEVGTVSQSPPFAFSPVVYGSAAHITPAATLQQIAQAGVNALNDHMKKTSAISITPLDLTETLTPADKDRSKTADETVAFSSILDLTRNLLGNITQVEQNAHAIENDYLLYRDRLSAIEARITTATQAVATARDTLTHALAANAGTAGDYAAAQRLVQEEIARVATATKARSDAIAAATGLFYVRQLQTIVTQPLAPSLSLTADTPADLVPGCETDHPGPPASVQPFLDLLLEVPLADWYWLRDFWGDLPAYDGLQRLGVMRSTRLSSWAFTASFGTGAGAPDLANIATATRSVFDPVFRSTLVLGDSLAVTQRAALGLFAYHDIISLPASRLRNEANALRGRFETAAGCLFETLTALSPSARFALATAARAGTLQPLSFSEWPIPQGLDSAGATAIRRLNALVNWMLGQLHDRSSAAAWTALGNLVRAEVIASAYGDPDDAVTGQVAGGVVLRPGVPIRVTLNRPPPIGTVLNVLDANQAVVGTVRVQDHDAFGTTAHVVTSFAPTQAATNWTIAGPTARVARLLA